MASFKSVVLFLKIMWYLLENSQCFSPWLVHPYLNKGLLQWFSWFLYSAGCVNVEVNKLDLLK